MTQRKAGGARPQRRAATPVASVSEAWLVERALRYLDRRDSSAANLRRHLLTVVARTEGDADAKAAAGALVEAVIERLGRTRVIDDARYAEVAARGLRARGGSARLIRQKLRARGIEAAQVDGALDATAKEGSELDAAREYARRRRLGPHRPLSERAARHERDLAALARAGFSFEVARRALAEGDRDDPAQSAYSVHDGSADHSLDDDLARDDDDYL